MPSLTCPACEHPISVADSAAGKRVMCGKCGEIIPVPRSFIYPDEDDAVAPYGRSWPRSWRDQIGQMRQGLGEPQIQGIVAMGTGLLSILLLCLPDAGFYMGSVLSGFGLLLGIIGTIQVLWRRGR